MIQDMNSRDQFIMRLKWALVFFLTMYAYMMVKADWLADPDVYWHVHVGQDIWSSFRLPTTDHYSYTATGKPWIAKEWLSQLIFFGIYKFLGWPGLAFFACSICALSLTILFWRFLVLVKWTIAVGLVWIAMPFLSVSLLARPQIFSFLLFAIALIEIEASVFERRRPALWLLVVSVLWANLHASFPILFGLLGFGGLEALARADKADRFTVIRQWSLFGFATLLTFGITPYGFGSFFVATSIVGSDLSRYISEWRPIEFHVSLEMPTEAWILSSWLFTLVIGSIAILWRYRRWPVRIAPVLVFAVLTMKHIRFCAMFTLVTAVMVARPIAERFQRFNPRALPTSASIMRAWRVSFGISLALALSTFTFIDRMPQKSITPQAAYEFAIAMGAEGRVYNSYIFGGYLISKGVPTLIDGRTELYFGGLLETILDPLVDRNRAAFSGSLKLYDAKWALVQTKSIEADYLAEMPQWSRVYRDDVAEVFFYRQD